MITFLGNTKAIEIYKDFINTTKNDKDIVVSCQYPFLVPESIINSNICVNIHYGNLPFFAGCDPIYWQIMKGSEAAVTLHYMDKNFDSGDIIDKAIVNCSNMTAEDLYAELSMKGFELFVTHYQDIIDGKAVRQPQIKEWRRYFNKGQADYSISCKDEREYRAKFFPEYQIPIMVGES